MELVTLLPDPQLLRLRLAVAQDFAITVAPTLEGEGGLADLLENRQVDLLIVDPGDRRLSNRPRSVAALLDQYEWVPAVLYTTLAPAGIKCASKLLRHGVRGLLLFGVDDQPDAIRLLVEQLTTDALAERLLTALAHPLAHLPPKAERAIRVLFGAPHRFDSVEDIASVAAMTRRHLVRVVTGAGLTSPYRLLAVARVIRAYQLLQSGRMSLEGAAARLRMEPRVLSRGIRGITDVPQALAIRSLTVDDLVTQCVRALYRPPTAVRAAVNEGTWRRA